MKINLCKRVIFQLALIGIICLIALVGYINTEFIAVKTNAQLPKAVIIDAGHGGFDGGAVAGDGTVEKDINLSIANKTADMLKLQGIKVVMTRTTDSGTESNESEPIQNRKKSDLQNRLQIMEQNPDAVFVSIHLNKFTTSSANGAQVFYTKNYKQANELALCIQKSIVDMIQPENTRVIKQGNDSTFLLKNAAVPAVIVECGFLSNVEELQKLKSDEYQTQMAFAVAGGIMNFLNKQ